MTSGETICAPATAPVNATLAIIRMSGSKTLGIARSVFTASDKIHDRVAAYGTIHDDGKIIDDVILTFYQGPRSFTGEDMAEITCHGNGIIVKKIISLLLTRGCCLAKPGEFSQRAFFNGKLDLTAAEAINHIISARSDWEIESALRQMHGSLKNSINELRTLILDLKADIESSIDFSHEDISFITPEETLARISAVEIRIIDIAKRCAVGDRMSRGIDMAIIGVPNVGKSSILNMILNEERAIVSDIPGTTRDTIRESVILGGLPVNIIDTAGITSTSDTIERIGMELSYRHIDSASLLLMIFDATRPLYEEEIILYGRVREKQHICLINKIDSPCEKFTDAIREVAVDAILFSAKTGTGFTELEKRIADLLASDHVDYSNTFVADARIRDLLHKGTGIAAECRQGIAEQYPHEITASGLQSLMEVLGDITGEITPDDVLDSIFSRFCIGK